MTLGHAPTEYRLRYTPDGQIHFNDPRLSQALTDLMEDGTLTIEQADNSTHIACVFYDGKGLQDGITGCNVYGIGRTPTRALRNALGWHFGSPDLTDGAVRTGVAFHATSHTDRIID